MKLLSCEYAGRAFAAVSDGEYVWEAAPDMPALIRALDGKLPGKELCAGKALPLADVKLLSPIPVPAQERHMPRHELRRAQRRGRALGAATPSSRRTPARPCTSPSAPRT